MPLLEQRQIDEVLERRAPVNQPGSRPETLSPARPPVPLKFKPRPASAERERFDSLQRGLELREPRDGEALLERLRALYAAARSDIGLGRLLAGHLGALQVIERLTEPDRSEAARQAARQGALYALWDCDVFGDPLCLEGWRLLGGKTFAAGAGLVTRVLVTVDKEDPSRARLLLVDLERHPPEIERVRWRGLSMQQAETSIVRWDGAEIGSDACVASLAAFRRAQQASHGPLLGAAVQAGAVAGLFDQLRAHLIEGDRLLEAEAAVRLSQLYGLADLAAALCRAAAERWFAEDRVARGERLASLRATMDRLADQALSVTRETLGPEPLPKKHPLSIRLAGLGAYPHRATLERGQPPLGKTLSDPGRTPGL